MNYKYKIGDKVKVITGGNGCSPDEKGEIATIIKLGVYFHGPGYVVDPPIGNCVTGTHDKMIGEHTFKLVASQKLSFEF